ncbi:MAG: hypothetical protein WDN08_16220 [Rhizomicrobium sp.]
MADEIVLEAADGGIVQRMAQPEALADDPIAHREPPPDAAAGRGESRAEIGGRLYQLVAQEARNVERAAMADLAEIDLADGQEGAVDDRLGVGEQRVEIALRQLALIGARYVLIELVIAFLDVVAIGLEVVDVQDQAARQRQRALAPEIAPERPPRQANPAARR